MLGQDKKKRASISSAYPLLLRENENRNRGIEAAQRKRKREEKSMRKWAVISVTTQNERGAVFKKEEKGKGNENE